MRIKLLTAAMVMGNPEVVTAGTVVESDDLATIAEYKALIAVGYAQETSEGGKADEPADLLDGTVGDVVAGLEGLDKAALKKLAKAESKGKGRVGVLDAIQAALDSE